MKENFASSSTRLSDKGLHGAYVQMGIKEGVFLKRTQKEPRYVVNTI